MYAFVHISWLVLAAVALTLCAVVIYFGIKRQEEMADEINKLQKKNKALADVLQKAHFKFKREIEGKDGKTRIMYLFGKAGEYPQWAKDIFKKI
jgi:uncharacterized protein HemX